MSGKALLAAYLRQQRDLAMPSEIPVSSSFDLKGFLRSIASRLVHAGAPIKAAARSGPTAPVPATRKPSTSLPAGAPNPYAKLSRLKPVASIIAPSGQSAPQGGALPPISSLPPLTHDEKRSVFKELFSTRCDKCHLSGTRHSFVFGAGNVDARLMLIGEAPGADEDRQGVPFVGAAGKLLTELLTAVSIDRKKDVFIANVLKCRPPANRTPVEGEIRACLPLLHRQIEVVAPAVLLLLGRTAAQAVLDTTQSLGALRGGDLDYRGITVVVTYHPSAILRAPEHRAEAEEDFRRVVRLLKQDRDHDAV